MLAAVFCKIVDDGSRDKTVENIKLFIENRHENKNFVIKLIAKEKNEGKRSESTVSRSDIEKVVSSWTGIPITKLTENESEKLLHLEDLIHKRLINQGNAVQAVSEAVRRGRIGLASANRPIASFIFLGPTGVGKTELAKTLAEILFGRQEMMVRLDMSEYSSDESLSKLLKNESGSFLDMVFNNPFSLILLDEFEKASSKIHNLYYVDS